MCKKREDETYLEWYDRTASMMASRDGVTEAEAKYYHQRGGDGWSKGFPPSQGMPPGRDWGGGE
jgi:hypothetical protein